MPLRAFQASEWVHLSLIHTAVGLAQSPLISLHTSCKKYPWHLRPPQKDQARADQARADQARAGKGNQTSAKPSSNHLHNTYLSFNTSSDPTTGAFQKRDSLFRSPLRVAVTLASSLATRAANPGSSTCSTNVRR
eukprot:411743-Pelagomonas_calceolata.AAC.1